MPAEVDMNEPKGRREFWFAAGIPRSGSGTREE
jgi:hypothetical protein